MSDYYVDGEFKFACSNANVFVYGSTGGCLQSATAGGPATGVQIVDDERPEFDTFFFGSMFEEFTYPNFLFVDIWTNGTILLGRNPQFAVEATSASYVRLQSPFFQQFDRIEGPFGSSRGALSAAEQVAALAKVQAGGSNNPSIRAEFPAGAVQPSLDKANGVVTHATGDVVTCAGGLL